MTYEFDFLAAALKEWNSLDKPVRERLHAKLVERSKAPRNPAHALRGDLRDCYKIKDSKSGNRLVYRIEVGEIFVLVIAIGKRERMAVYKEAARRINIYKNM